MGGAHRLKCGDRTLLSFEFTEDEFGTPGARVLDSDPALSHLMPWGLAADGESLYRWLSVRALPRSRRYAEELCRSMGFSVDDVESVYSVSAGLSLNDSYWTPREDDDRPFSEVNLYSNGFSEVLAAVAYTGVSAGPSPRDLTPELTIDGTLRKAWRVAPSGERVLFKGASEGWRPGEPVSELIASWVAREAGFDAVTYGLGVWDGEICSTCPCFCSPGTAYAPFAVATGIRDLGLALAFCHRLGDGVLEAFRDMLVLDCLLMNTDRHFTNFGLLRDTATGAALGLAPVFDNGRGLLPMLSTPMLADAGPQVSVMAPSFGGRTFDQLAARVMGPRQHSWLMGLDGIDLGPLVGDLAGTGLERAVEGRCRGLEPILRERVAALLEIEPVPIDAMRPALERAWRAKAPGISGDNLCPACASWEPGPEPQAPSPQARKTGFAER